MLRVSEQQIDGFLRQHAIPGLDAPLQIEAIPAEFDGQRYRVRTPSASYILNCYAPTARESASREIAGLRLGGSMGLAPSLIWADEQSHLGGPALLFEDQASAVLGDGRLSDADAQAWLFLLLTLHHLPTSGITLQSSMSQDLAMWWQRTQPIWQQCRAAYADARFRPLLDTLTRLHAIVGARVEVNRDLWSGVRRTPCHGNPVTAHVARSAGRLMLLEWSTFGLGDPAIEVGRAAALAALSGALDATQYVRLISDYLAGRRDARDATCEDRVRVVASVLPLGFCFTALSLLAQDGAATPANRARGIEQVTRGLIWIHDTLGVSSDDPQALLAPLHI